MRRLLVLVVVGAMAVPGTSVAAGGPPYEGGVVIRPCGHREPLAEATTTCSVNGLTDPATGRFSLEAAMSTALGGDAPGIGTVYTESVLVDTEPVSGAASRREYLFTFDIDTADVDIVESSPVSPLMRSIQGEIVALGSVQYAEPVAHPGGLTGFTEGQTIQFSEGSTGPVTIVTRAVIETGDGAPLPAGTLRLIGGATIVLMASGPGSVEASVRGTLRSITPV